MNCPKCGTQIPDSSQVCNSCGFSIAGSPTAVQMATVTRTSGWAIAALVCGIFSPFTCGITGILAIIFGIIALVEINKSSGVLKGNGLAITGIILPSVLIPILLMLILMPALFKVRMMAQRVVCGANLSGLGKAMSIYANEHKDEYPTADKMMAQRVVCGANLSGLGKAMSIYANKHKDEYPTADKWCDLLVENADVSQKSFRCRGASQGPCNYAMNENIQKLGPPAPPDMVLLFETSPGWNQVGGPEILTTKNHKGEGCNVLFNDGRVEFIKTKDLDKLLWDVKEKTQK